MEEHVPVLLHEAIDGLNIRPDGIYLDLTIGRAGHAREILKRLSPRGLLVGLDRDPEAIEASAKVLAPIGKNYRLYQANHRDFRAILEELSISSVDGILMDLGVSSPQFDCTGRGFSYRGRAKLDMRMDPGQSLSAFEVVNDYPLKDLLRVFREYGEDRYAYPIAKRIVAMRKIAPIETTEQLVTLIKSVKPMKELARKGHPAKQTFQALRIEVNDEWHALKAALKDALISLCPGGRLVVISFQSLEDRTVKRSFTSACWAGGDRHGVIAPPGKIKEPAFTLINRHVIVPGDEEIKRNPRARTARMRIIERRTP